MLLRIEEDPAELRQPEHPGLRRNQLKTDKMLQIHKIRASCTRQTVYSLARDALGARAASPATARLPDSPCSGEARAATSAPAVRRRCRFAGWAPTCRTRAGLVQFGARIGGNGGPDPGRQSLEGRSLGRRSLGRRSPAPELQFGAGCGDRILTIWLQASLRNPSRTVRSGMRNNRAQSAWNRSRHMRLTHRDLSQIIIAAMQFCVTAAGDDRSGALASGTARKAKKWRRLCVSVPLHSRASRIQAESPECGQDGLDS